MTDLLPGRGVNRVAPFQDAKYALEVNWVMSPPVSAAERGRSAPHPPGTPRCSRPLTQDVASGNAMIHTWRLLASGNQAVHHRLGAPVASALVEPLTGRAAVMS